MKSATAAARRFFYVLRDRLRYVATHTVGGAVFMSLVLGVIWVLPPILAAAAIVSIGLYAREAIQKQARLGPVKHTARGVAQAWTHPVRDISAFVEWAVPAAIIQAAAAVIGS